MAQELLKRDDNGCNVLGIWELETQAPPIFYQARPKNVRMIFEE